MTSNKIPYYKALVSRDPRFDGVFFVGVTSTGIYCRPVCPARTPKESNCRFFDNAATAEKEHFRPCLRCRPELAPGIAPVDDAQRIAHLIVEQLAEGSIDDQAGMEKIAAQFDLGSRQLRRIIQKQLGVSPIELIQTRRLLLSKQLLTETNLAVTDIAFASGFSSLRRFNDAFLKRYKMPPSRLRKASLNQDKRAHESDMSKVMLSYRPPYDWPGILDFLRGRMLKGAEWVTDDSYYRTVRIGEHQGWIAVTHKAENQALMVEFSHSLLPVLPALLNRLRHLFDLSARPDIIAAQLNQDKNLKKAVDRNPGLRVPGAFDGFELAVRAILGQQITVKAATTLACRFAAEFGDAIDTPFAQLNRISPSAERIAGMQMESIAKLGIIRARAQSIIAVANACISGDLTLHAGAHPDKTMDRLKALPGIGPWTAHYIAMRALRWPDSFPKEDIAIRKSLGGVTAKQAEEMSQNWRPWRSYAVLHLWRDGG